MSIKQNNNDSNKEMLSGDYLNFTSKCCVSDNKFNYDTISKYYSIVYKSDLKNVPSVDDLTFLWAHIIGDLDDWAKNGLAGNASDFRWNNQPLPTPLPFLPFNSPNNILNTNIVSTLPRENTIWTPDWYTYPQASINRYNPKWWNQFYFDFMGKYATNLPENPTANQNARFNYNNIQENITFEVSNTGGPAPNGDGTQTFFFYHAVGSGIRMTVDKCLFAMNKIHAYYVYQCALSGATPTTAFNKVVTDLSGTDLINQMNQALTLKSGYFALPDQTFVDTNLWTPLLKAYPSVGTDNQQKIHAVVCYNIGLKPYTLSTDFNAPSPNIVNADCVASNAFNGLLPSGFDPLDKDYVGTSNVACFSYEYYVQVATNLTVMDNILDTYVNKILDHTENNLGINAVINLAQWNALGGWTAEIPSYYGLITTGQKPVFKPANGCTFDAKTVSGEGWNILGINNYATSCPCFEIPNKYL